MKQYKVYYSGGESRWYPGVGVDYMQVTVEVYGEEYRLYAERPYEGLTDEQGNPPFLTDENGYEDWNPACKDPEWLSVPYLVKAIRTMCDEIGLDPSRIDFDGWDDPDKPQYMVDGLEAKYRIS